MAFSSDLVLKDNAAVNKTFTVIKTSGQRVERFDTSTTTALPRKLVLDHSVVNSKTVKSDRHLIQVAAAESDGAGGSLVTIVNLTITIPTAATSNLGAKHAFAFIADMLQDAGAANAAFDQLTRGES